MEMVSQKATMQVSIHPTGTHRQNVQLPHSAGLPLEAALIYSPGPGLEGDWGENRENQGPLRR